jgi:hypothetical protein
MVLWYFVCSILNVPVHQIRSAWMWYGLIGLGEYKDREMPKGIYNLAGIFLKFYFYQQYCKTWSAVHAIRGFRKQICMQSPILYMQRMTSTVSLIFKTFVGYFTSLVQNELSIPEIIS